jgi:hypothetical protein
VLFYKYRDGRAEKSSFSENGYEVIKANEHNSGCIHAVVSRIYSITVDRLTQQFYMSTSSSTYTVKPA